jgi:hypothetical protein
MKSTGKIILPIMLSALCLAICLAGLNLTGEQSSALAASRFEIPDVPFRNNGSWEAALDSSAPDTIFIPLVTKDFIFHKALSTVTATASSFTDCTTPAPPGEQCAQLNITCPTSSPIQVSLRVTEPPITATLQGTLIFFSGWTGGTWWAETWLSNNVAILNHLRNAGFRTVETKWPDSVGSTWWVGWTGAGMAQMGCRPATVIQWVYDNLHSDKTLPYCATGHSNGASQLGLALVYYGMEGVLDAAVFESGPNWARIDKSCLCDDPAYSSICYSSASGGEIIDWSYGERYGLRPCALKVTSYRPTFLYDSLVSDMVNDIWRYHYANTSVSFLFGLGDSGQTAINGKLYYQKLISFAPTNVFSTTVTGAGHYVTNSDLGAQVMEDTLKNTCVKP